MNEKKDTAQERVDGTRLSDNALEGVSGGMYTLKDVLMCQEVDLGHTCEQAWPADRARNPPPELITCSKCRYLLFDGQVHRCSQTYPH